MDGKEAIGHREAIKEQFTPLVMKLARQYYPEARGRCELDDLAQEGFLGLMAAADRYDPAKGAKFSTFAYAQVAGAIRRFIRDRTHPIHVPAWLQESPEGPRALAGLSTVSLDAPRASGEGTLADAVADARPESQPESVLDRHFENAALERVARKVYASLPDKRGMQAILDGLTNAEAAQAYGASEREIKASRQMAISRVRAAAKAGGVGR